MLPRRLTGWAGASTIVAVARSHASPSSPWRNSRGRRLRLLLGLFVVEAPRILLQYSSFLRLDPEQNPRRDTAREFRHGLLGVIGPTSVFISRDLEISHSGSTYVIISPVSSHTCRIAHSRGRPLIAIIRTRAVPAGFEVGASPDARAQLNRVLAPTRSNNGTTFVNRFGVIIISLLPRYSVPIPC